MYVLLCSFLPQCTCTLSTSLSCSFPRNNFYWIIFHYFSFELRGKAVATAAAESANIAWPTRTETLDLGDRRLESRRAWPSSSGPSKTIKSKTSEQCKWQVMISLLCAVKRGARRSTRSRTKTKNPKTKKCGGTGWDWGWGLLFFWYGIGTGIGPKDEEDATVANNDANANANDGPKTRRHDPKQCTQPKEIPYTGPEAKSAASGEPTKYFTHTLCPKCWRARGLTRSMQLFAPF